MCAWRLSAGARPRSPHCAPRPRHWGSIRAIAWAGQLPRDAITPYLHAADALVIPDTVTDVTASPLKLFEYLAAERAVVLPDIPALAEVLSPQIGYYFRRGDTAGLAAALHSALADPGRAERERAGRAGCRAAHLRRARRRHPGAGGGHRAVEPGPEQRTWPEQRTKGPEKLENQEPRTGCPVKTLCASTVGVILADRPRCGAMLLNGPRGGRIPRFAPTLPIVSSLPAWKERTTTSRSTSGAAEGMRQSAVVSGAVWRCDRRCPRARRGLLHGAQACVS